MRFSFFMNVLFCTLGFLPTVYAHLAASKTAAPPAPIKILVISGGENSKHTRFYKLFKDRPDLAITEINEGELTETPSVYDRPDLLSFDVVFLYDYQTKISSVGKKEFLTLFDKGVGLIALHDALLSYQDWP